MIRLHVIVEGETEEAFCNAVLASHLGPQTISVDTRNLKGWGPRGSGSRYQKARNFFLKCLKEDSALDSWFTTMLDFYGLPSDFPGLSEASQLQAIDEKITILEDRLRQDLDGPWCRRFIPYLQVHEFEALLFADIAKLDSMFPGREAAVRNLVHVANGFPGPEDIDDDPKTAPSKRIIAEIPEYDGRKVSVGPLVAQRIGVATLRARCPHFQQWISKLESLPSSTAAAAG